AERLRKEAGSEPREQVVRAWQLAFCRQPTDAEVTQTVEFLKQQTEELPTLQPEPSPAANAPEKAKSNDEKAKSNDEKAAPPAQPDYALQALTNLCQTLLSA